MGRGADLVEEDYPCAASVIALKILLILHTNSLFLVLCYIIWYHKVMPNLITHHLFGQEIVKKLPTSLQEIVQKYPKEFSLGTQGPDLFFYYNAWPWLRGRDAKVVTKIGSIIHQKEVHTFFNEALEDLVYGHSRVSSSKELL